MSWLSKITGIHLPGSGKKTFEGGITGGIVEGLKSTGKILTFQHTTGKDWQKAGILGGSIAGAYYLWPTTPSGAIVGPTGLEIEAAAGTGQSLWVEPAFAVSEQGAMLNTTGIATGYASGMELEAAAGAAVIPWVEPGTSTGLFSSISSGLKTVAEGLGITKSLFGSPGGAPGSISMLIDREVSGLFKGSEDSGKSVSALRDSSGGSGKAGLEIWPIILIVLAVAFIILTRKGKS